MLTAGSFIFRHWKKIMAVLLVLLLLIVMWLDKKKDPCAPGGAASVSTDGLAYPVDVNTPISSPFGMRGGEMHAGTDLAGQLGAPIYAFADGRVVAAQDQGVQGFGGWVVITHTIEGKEMSTVYGHMDPGGVMVSTGQEVKAGQQIARLGNSGRSSGPHLHFEIHEGNRLTANNPIDPGPWLEKVKNSSSSSTPPGDNSDTPAAPPAAGNEDQARTLRIRQIIDAGQQQNASEDTIVAALAACKVESDCLNLASNAVPESLNYPNDGTTPGDADSVGLFQNRVSIWSDTFGGLEKMMDPVEQIKWFYTTAATAGGSTPGELAANVERPREDLRWKYSAEESWARQAYETNGDSAAGALGTSLGNCIPGANDGDIPPSSELGMAILRYARPQFGLPYVWGGGTWDGPSGGGFDCSGLVLYSVAQATNHRVHLLHNDAAQINDPHVARISWDQKEPGDLLQWDHGHIAIYSGKNAEGIDMMYEAQQTGVPVGEYPVRDIENVHVGRVKGE